MNLKHNINRIHVELLNNFEMVSISEKSSLEFGNYIEFIINESNKIVKVIISKKEVENQKFDWKYFSNPNGDSSYLVERSSTVDSFTSIVKDIFEKNRFDSEYLKSLND